MLMNLSSLREERSRVSEEFRTKLASLAALRSLLADAVKDEVREHLYMKVDKEAELCRHLGAQLLQLDGLITEAELRVGQQTHLGGVAAP
jgi:hypothetical protein